VSTSSEEQEALADILKTIILPQVERNGMDQTFTAPPRWQPDMDLPEGMTATRKSLRGKRVPVRGMRAYGSMAVVEASWPEDNLHSARTPKLCFILRFPTMLQVSDYVLHCRPGHGILLPPGIPFTYRYDSSLPNQEMLQMMPYHGGLICWHTRHWQDAARKPHVREQSCSVPRSQAVFYINQLVEEAVRNAPRRRLVCDSLLKIMLVLLLREIWELPVLRTGEMDTMNPRPLAQTAYSIKQVQQYIERNLREPLSIDKVARYVCMSRTVFTAWFRAKTGKSFSRYLQDLRFEEACELLRGGDLGVHHIAAAVGLKPGRLRVLFQEREGIPPLEYRRRNRLDEEKEAANTNYKRPK
jgi:AraC-like DNA-binding protein